MKLLFQISMLIISLAFVSCNGTAQNTSAKQTALSANKIEVIDFHSTHRCFTCKSIEANAKYTLDTYFSEQLEDGTITWAVVNVDEKENEAIAEKFEAVSTALFLNVIKDGTEKQIDLTDFAFMQGTEKEKFTVELKQKIEEELKVLLD